MRLLSGFLFLSLTFLASSAFAAAPAPNKADDLVKPTLDQLRAVRACALERGLELPPVPDSLEPTSTTTKLIKDPKTGQFVPAEDKPTAPNQERFETMSPTAVDQGKVSSDANSLATKTPAQPTDVPSYAMSDQPNYMTAPKATTSIKLDKAANQAKLTEEQVATLGDCFKAVGIQAKKTPSAAPQ